jgi:simple sugar transport system permease protein
MALPFRIIKNEDANSKKTIVIRSLAILLSLVSAGIILLFFGLNPIEVFFSIVDGSLGSGLRIKETILRAIPLTITSLGILVAFKLKFWNIGGEGQILMGALGATLVALGMPNLPSIVLLPAMAIMGIAFGAVWALIPAFFKVRFGTNETIFTLMMNYVALKFLTYLQYGPLKGEESSGFPKIPNFSENAVLPKVFGIHIGWIIAIVLVIFLYYLMEKTKLGFEIAVTGESPNTARYAGMNINTIVLVSILISGGLCGLVGMIQASAVEKTLTFGISAGYGFTAIITTWLARLNPITTLFVCFAFSVLLQGASYIQLSLGVPSAVAGLVEGLVLFFVLGSEFFISYKIRRVRNG